ncbi:prepilin-type N-terminal cleavage/methylation domain-containing protein [Thalassovita mangrovi]|uniref:Prepilin-type N-terminal cleavage/methylation domain-containing protein n=1 Tax=Thalassovita mangrovi TaxID=2692236 RepID=A0A6L8LJC7_9RHOB|nr:prepilin-type N-terminal cleavage/methylation domain-containing protein [Thalassovita mangrovi]MYM55955.1 prepilin-type N-terminal cleavage/methylation domain-containing protein [Thalassovita mangrovi]
MGRAIGPDAGFTLIELLIAVAVMAVLAVGASLTALGGAREDSDLARFRAQFDTARMLAITGQQSRGLTISSRGMQPAEHGAEGWSPAGRELRWRGRVALSVPQTARMGGTGTPDLVFLANGQTTPFRLGFSDGGRVVSCRSDGWTGLTCDGD